MAPPPYSSTSCSWSSTSLLGLLGALGVVPVCVTFHLHLVESDGCFVGIVEGAREHAPNEEAERTETHQQGACVGSSDLEAFHGSVSLGGRGSGSAECRSLLLRVRARDVSLVRRVGLQIEIV